MFSVMWLELLLEFSQLSLAVYIGSKFWILNSWKLLYTTGVSSINLTPFMSHMFMLNYSFDRQFSQPYICEKSTCSGRERTSSLSELWRQWSHSLYVLILLADSTFCVDLLFLFITYVLLSWTKLPTKSWSSKTASPS